MSDLNLAVGLGLVACSLAILLASYKIRDGLERLAQAIEWSNGGDEDA